MNPQEKSNRSIELCTRVVTTESLIEEAKAIYGDKYDYGKTRYRSKRYKIVVTCPTHGDFEVFAREHLDGKGCPKCAKGEKFIQKLQDKFGDKFLLDKFVYESSTSPVELICPTHGSFKRTPSSVLNSVCGCPDCGNELARSLNDKAHAEAEKRKTEERKKKEEERRHLCVVEVGECTKMRINKVLKNIDLPESFVGIDFETLYSQRVSACSVGMVKYKDGQIVDRYYSLIRPPFEYPGKCGVALTWIHGFTEEMLQNERTFEEILPEMETFVEGLPLVAHNACVERACIHDTSEFYEIATSLDYNDIIDTYPLSKRIEQMMGCEVVGSGTHSLDAVCRRFNVPAMHHHNALDDAEMCGNLLLAFKEILSNTDEIIQPIAREVVVTPKINPEDKIQRTDLENIGDNPFKDKVIVLTGFAKADSQLYAHQLNELGAIIKDSVNKKTNILITGYNAGPSKLKKAEELGVQIIHENDFLEMLKSI